MSINGIMVALDTRSDMAGKGSGVIHRHSLGVLSLLQVLAAGLMTAIFIYRYPPLIVFQDRMIACIVHSRGDRTARPIHAAGCWYHPGFLTGSGG